MKKSGSITVFTSLFLAVFLLVFQVLLQSVQIGGGRVQAETGVEEGLYSVFAGYDRELLERYHVFMVDGSYGTGVWKPECMYQTVKKCMMRFESRTDFASGSTLSTASLITLSPSSPVSNINAPEKAFGAASLSESQFIAADARHPFKA